MYRGYRSKRDSLVSLFPGPSSNRSLSNLGQKSLQYQLLENEVPERKDKIESINSKVQNRTIKIDEVHVTSLKNFPINLNTEVELQNMIQSGLFTEIESSSLQLFQKFCHMISGKRYIKMVNLLFWIIFLLKLQSGENLELLTEMRNKLGKLYGKYFAALVFPKEELSNFGILTAAYACHLMFYNLFPLERKRFDRRFILNCYHIVIFELNGIFVSDSYVQNSIEKLFGNRFYFYEVEEQEKNKPQKKEVQNDNFLLDHTFDFYKFSQVPGGITFAKELSNKLAPKKLKISTRRGFNEDAIPKTTQPSPLTKLIHQVNVEENFTRIDQKSFPRKLKLNCHQLSPTVSAFLDNTTSSLPCQKKKQINYSTRKPILNLKINESESLMLQDDRRLHVEKNEKEKNQVKGSIGDYKLKARPESYYLKHLPKSLRTKFSHEIDLKYIMDNVKVSFREIQTTRESKEQKSNLSHLFKAQETGNHYKETHFLNKASALICEDFKNCSKTENLKANEVLLNEPLSDKILRKPLENEGKAVLPQIISKAKGLELCLVKSMSLPFLKAKPQVSVLEELGERKEIELDHVRKLSVPLEYEKESLTTKIKYDHKVNRQLGKGQTRIKLEQAEKGRPIPKTHREFVYKDNRLDYMKKHGDFLKGSTDANINELVQKLLVKQNIFHRNFGKYAKLNQNKKKS